jgi:hypothetical protein
VSFKFGGVLVEHREIPPTDSSDAILAALHEGRVHRLDVVIHPEEASSRDAEAPSVTSHRGCVIIFDREAGLRCEFEQEGMSKYDARLAALTMARPEIGRAMVFHLDGTSGTYAFSVFADGSRVRRWAFIPTDPEPLRIDEGAPLPTEPQGEVHGESRIAAASRALLGDRSILALTSEHDAPVFACEVRPR